MNSPLRFGVLSYLNCLPATLALEEGRVGAEELRVERGTPAELNAKMRLGELDVSVVSVAEYLLNRDLYVPVEGYSLWCDGPVQSVCLYSPFPREELGRTIGVTPESATSVALVEILLPAARTEPFTHLDAARVGLEEGDYGAVLLIGDSALEPPEWTKAFQTHDLGRWWKDETGHPMTYAIWVARRHLSDESRQTARELLERSLIWGESHLEQVLREGNARSGVSVERLRAYLARIQYRTTPKSVAGFDEFERRAHLRIAPVV